MSKSKHNGVNPKHIADKYGVDALRLYILFKAPPEIPLQWTNQEIVGPFRWLSRLLHLCDLVKSTQDIGGSSTSNKDHELIVCFNVALQTV